MEFAEVSYAATRWMGYLGAFLAIGAVVFRVAVLPAWHRAHPGDLPVTSLLSTRAARLGLLGGMVLVASTGLRLWFQVRTFLEPGEAANGELLRTIVADTPWGHGWMAQLGASVLVLGGFLAALTIPRIGWVAAGIGATLVAAASPMTGHAVTQAAGGGGQVLDALHLLAGSAWLGTLTVTLAAGIAPLARLDDTERGVLTARLIRAFSPVALVGAALAVSVGALMSWNYLGGSVAERVAALTGTAWGRALLFKLGALAVVAGLGAWNWRVLLPRLGSADAARSLHRSARREVLMGLVLLGVTAVLVALPMPAEAFAPAP